jgi:predicted transcriptional regulator YdeE
MKLSRNLKNDLRSITKLYGFKIRFSCREVDGSANCEQGIIYLSNRPKNIIEYVSWFFHELAHLINTVNGKYINYHLGNKNYRFTAVKAEKYTDKVGEKLMKLWLPEYKYIKSYRTSSDFELLRKRWKRFDMW